MNRDDHKAVKAACRHAYLTETTNLEVLASKFHRASTTIRRWRDEGKWDEHIEEEANLEKAIEVSEKKAYLAALKQFNEAPADTNLQHLVALLKARKKTTEPARELNEYIVKFLDQTTDYFVIHGLETLLKLFQEQLVDLADYLRTRNSSR